ncbi:hypothetical protein ZWY2020_050400 [Hordeum vulgare]|nr:hypothetical protein ZWY2020_050400 [Hordeum vulgare]
MDSIVNQGWTSSEVEEAWSLIASLNTKKIVYDDNDDKNKKHNYIVNSLHALFPSKTMKQVTDLYVNLAMEMHMIQRREGTHFTGGTPQNSFTFCDTVNGKFELPGEENGTSSTHGVYTLGSHANDNFGVREEATMMDNNVLSFGCAMEDMGITVTGEAPQMIDNNKMEVLENNIFIDQPVVVPHQWGFWTGEEHRSFLYGLKVYGRGDWKNISKHFVSTKTPIQVSSHAQKFFKRIQKKASSGTKRYSINDVRLDDNDLLAANNSSAPRQALSFTGLNNNPSFKLQAPTSSFTVMNNLAQCSLPSIINKWVSSQCGVIGR